MSSERTEALLGFLARLSDPYHRKEDVSKNTGFGQIGTILGRNWRIRRRVASGIRKRSNGPEQSKKEQNQTTRRKSISRIRY